MRNEDFNVGDCYVMYPCRDGSVIFGEVLPLCHGRLCVKGYSDACIEGEIGSLDVEHVKSKITREEFEKMRENLQRPLIPMLWAWVKGAVKRVLAIQK